MSIHFVGLCTIFYLWDWWKSPSPLGAVGSGGSRCRGQLRTPRCDHQDTPAHWSSSPGSRSLTHKRTPVSSGRMSLRKSLSGPTLCHRVRLHVPIVVFAGPNEAAVRFHSLGHHVIDQAMLIPDAFVLKMRHVFPEDKRAEKMSPLHFSLTAHSVFIQQGLSRGPSGKPAFPRAVHRP